MPHSYEEPPAWSYDDRGGGDPDWFSSDDVAPDYGLSSGEVAPDYDDQDLPADGYDDRALQMDEDAWLFAHGDDDTVLLGAPGERQIRSHRRREPLRTAAFRVMVAAVVSGAGLTVAIAAAGGSTPAPVAQDEPWRRSETVAVSPDATEQAIESTPDAAVPAPTTTTTTQSDTVLNRQTLTKTTTTTASKAPTPTTPPASSTPTASGTPSATPSESVTPSESATPTEPATPTETASPTPTADPEPTDGVPAS